MKRSIVLGCLLFPSLAFAANGAEINVYGGKAISNSIADTSSRAWGIEQETPTSFGTWVFGYLNEGHQNGDKRDGIYALPKFSYQLNEKLETSIAIGPYFTATTITEPDGVHYQDKYRFAGLGFAKVKYSLSESWAAFGAWGHVMYRRDNKDADVFVLGLGRKF